MSTVRAGWKWIAGGVLLAAAALIGWAAISGGASSSPSSTSVRSEVVRLTAGDKPLTGQPIDLIGVGDRYLGLVKAGSDQWTVTSDDGREWRARPATELPAGTFERSAYPGGLGNVRHIAFTDGTAVYLRGEGDAGFSRIGSKSLYVSDATARQWRPVTLPAPAGMAAFPIAAAVAGERRYLAGAVYTPPGGPDYLDAAIWISDRGGPWRLIDSPAFSGSGNQTIFTLDVRSGAVLAGGGDSALAKVDTCCFFPDGAALWRSPDRGDHWTRTPLAGAERFGPGAVLDFRNQGPAVETNTFGNPPRTATTRDRGTSWAVTVHRGASGGVLVPTQSQTLRRRGRSIATTSPSDFCGDCEEGALAISADGETWRDVTPPFPCGTEGRPSNGFVSKPVAVGGAIAALAGCGEELSAFNETLLAISTDRGAKWRIRRFDGPTGGPMPAVTGSERIVTLAGGTDGPGPIRAVVVTR
jgi:hypothetical protein